MVKINKGAVKFKSIKAAYESAKKHEPNLKYITFYMRQRKATGGLAWSISEAYATPVRAYNRQIAA